MAITGRDEYTIVTTFGGTKSYYGSRAETALGVTTAVTASTPIEPEEPTPEQSTPEEPTPEEPEPTVEEQPLIGTELAIALAIVTAYIIGAVVYIALRRKQSFFFPFFVSKFYVIANL